MSKIDILLLVIALIGAWKGYQDGFLVGLFSFIGIVAGIFMGFKLMREGMLFLHKQFNADQATLPYISFIAIFLIVLLLVTMFGRWLKGSVDKTFLGRIDELMGALLGTFKILFLASVLLWIAHSLNFAPPASWSEGSWLYPFTAKLAPDIAAWLAEFVPVFREILQ